MAFSKFSAPKRWLKLHYDIVNEPVDPDLFSEDEYCASLVEQDLCHDRSVAMKYVNTIGAYHFMRHHVPTLVKNPLNNQLFKLNAYLAISLFMSDDLLEQISPEDRVHVYNAYNVMQDEISKNFPKLPSIPEMQQFLSQKNFTKYSVRHALYLVDYTNNVAKAMLELGNFPVEETRDYWKRLAATLAFFLEGVELETTLCTSADFSKYIWVRAGSAAAVQFSMVLEVAYKAVTSMRAHMPLLNQLMFIDDIICFLVNDIYSYHFEKSFKYISNAAERLLVCKKLPGLSEAMAETAKMVNAYVKLLYNMIEKAREENPDNQVLFEIMEGIAAGSVGWYFFHHCSAPRYGDALWRLSLDEVEEDCEKEWKSSNEGETIELEISLSDSYPIPKMLSDRIINGTRPTLLGILN